MEKTTLKKLLQADEEKIKKSILSKISAEKDRKQCIENLSNEFGTILRKYNSAYPQDKIRQSAADAEVSVVRKTLDVLMATSEKKESSGNKEQAPKVPVFAIIAIALCLVTAVLIFTKKLAVLGVLCLFASVALALLSDNILDKGGKVETIVTKVTLDPEALWNILVGITGVMDEKIEELLKNSSEYIKSQVKASSKAEASKAPEKAETSKAPDKAEANKASNKDKAPASKPADNAEAAAPFDKIETFDTETLQMFGYLLETLYFWDGVHALNQLSHIRTYLKKSGIELTDYDGNNEEMFELVPSKNKNKTLRPAMLANNKLLLPGLATKPDLRNILI